MGSIVTRLDELDLQIRIWAKAYYCGEIMVSDQVFDAAVEELRSIDPTAPVLTIVGWGAKYGESCELPCEMNSLDKYFNAASVKQVIDRLDTIEWYSIQPKLDGASGALKYDDEGNLMLACSREGVILTAKIPYLRRGPIYMKGPRNKTIKGEFVIPRDLFKEFLAGNYANERNAVSGIVISQKGFENLQYLDFVAHNWDPDFMGPSAQTDLIESLHLNDNYLEAQYRDWKVGRYLIDGLVVCPVEMTDRKVAYKVKTETVIGTVKQVIWTLQDTLQLTPTIELEERFTLYGTSVGDSIAAFNAQYVKENRIGPGAVVEVTKANEIIPYIVNVISAGNPREPDYSMVDATHEHGWGYVPTSWEDKPILWDGSRIFVEDPDAQVKFRINRFLGTYFTAKGAVDADKLRRALKIEELDDIYWRMGESIFVRKLLVDFNENNQRFTGPQIETIVPMFAPMRKLDARYFLLALALRNVGDTLSERAASRLYILGNNAPETFIELIKAPSHAAQSIRENWAMIVKAYHVFSQYNGLFIPTTKTEGTNGVTVCMTGPGWTTRAMIEQILKEAGYVIHGGVGKDTQILVQADPKSQTSKSKAASKYGTKIISYSDLKIMLSV